MKKQLKNKKIIITAMAIMTSFVLVLTGTFAWNAIEEANTGGEGYSYDYLVKLMDNSTNPLIIKKNWKEWSNLSKKVYATSDYANSYIKESYDAFKAENPNAVFSDTWVRIQLEETLTKNGVDEKKIVKKVVNGDVVSNFNEFELSNEKASELIVSIKDWDGKEQGRFWILDEATGWLYWAQPLQHASKEKSDVNQTTDHIIDSVLLRQSPAGVWTYQIKATLDAMDIELDGYKHENAWEDVLDSDKIYGLFGKVEEEKAVTYPIEYNEENFPDIDFYERYFLNGIDKNDDNILSEEEALAVTDLDLMGGKIGTLYELRYFPNLKTLKIAQTGLRKLDVSHNPKLESLILDYNYFLHQINFNNNPALVNVQINKTQIKNLSFGNSTAIKTLNVDWNCLSTIDVSALPHLKEFIYENQTVYGTEWQESQPVTVIGWPK